MTTLPKEIDKLNEDLTIAAYELEEYSEIFRESETRIDLLNKVAPAFFVKLQEMFWDKFIMTISRFTDPEGNSDNRNLSIDILIKFIGVLNVTEQNLISENLAIIKKNAKQIRKFRSKYISHRDLKHALIDQDTIGTIELNKVEKIYQAIGDCLNMFNTHYSGSTILFGAILSNNGARSLIHFIKEGVIYNEFKVKRQDYMLNEMELTQSKFKDS